MVLIRRKTGVFWPLCYSDARGYKNMKISPELIQEMFDRSILVYWSGAFHGKPGPVLDHGPTT